MNLATARSTLRSKEIGLRKVLGAGQSSIIKQFIGESIFITFLAIILACQLVQIILPTFNLIAEQELTFSLLDKDVLLGIITLLLITGLIAGSYPALYLSSFRPIIILKGMIIKGKSGVVFRRVSVVFQFSLSIILIIGTIIIFKQQFYLLNKDIGFEKDGVVSIRMQGEVNNKFNTIKPLLLQHPNIDFVSRSAHSPLMIGSNTGGITWDGSEETTDLLIGFSAADYDYEKTLGMEMVEGRFFSSEYGTDSLAVVLNENTVKLDGNR